MRTWLALTDDEPDGATARARVEEGGWIAAWVQRAKPVRGALRVDPRVVDPQGAACVVSLVLPPAGVRVPMDDLAVQQARRLILAGPPPRAVTTFLSDASHFEGSLLVDPPIADPFARLFPARRLSVGAGIFGAAPPPAGPTIERYGSANPWPADRFSEP